MGPNHLSNTVDALANKCTCANTQTLWRMPSLEAQQMPGPVGLNTRMVSNHHSFADLSIFFKNERFSLLFLYFPLVPF